MQPFLYHMQNNYLRQIPLVRILIPFVCGVSISLYIEFDKLVIYGLLLLSLVANAYLIKKTFGYRFEKTKGFGVYLIVFLFGISLNLYQNQLTRKNHFSKIDAVYYLIKINEKPLLKKRSIKAEASVIASLDSIGNVRENCIGKIIVYFDKSITSKTVQYGDCIVIPKYKMHETTAPRNPEEFNYKRYLSFHNIFHQASIDSSQYQITGTNIGSKLTKKIYDVQAYFDTVLTQYVVYANATGVAQALLYGNDDEIDPETIKAYANTGTLHVLAVSGMHVGIIFMILSWILTFMDKRQQTKVIKNILILFMLWGYSFLCGLSPSILRATVMFSFMILGKIISRKTNIFNTLAASAFCLICFDTNILANVGFQLSYLAVLGIVGLQKMIYNWYEPKNRIIDEIWKITSVSIAAQFTTFPVGLLYFHQFPNYFLFSNLIIIPLTTLILYGCIILLLISKINAIATLLGKGIYYLILLTNSIVVYVEQLPYSFISGIHISIFQTICIYVIVIAFICYLVLIKKYWLYTLLSSACVLAATNSFYLLKSHYQNSIILYDIKGKTAMHFISGRTSTLLIDSTLWHDRDKIHYHLQQHFWKSRINDMHIVYNRYVWQKVKFGNCTLLLSGKENISDTSVYAEKTFVIRNKMHPNMLAKIIANKTYVLDCLSDYQQNVIAEKVKCNDVKYLAKSGSIQLSL